MLLNTNGGWNQYGTIGQVISGIVFDNANMIWLSKNNGVARYENDKWLAFENQYLPKTETYCVMFRDSKNNLWFGST